MIGIGIIGCGTIAQVRHAPEYHANSKCKLIGYFDAAENRMTKLAAQYGGKIYDSIEAMLNDSDIDAVSVCTSNDTHAAISIRALEAGKHVLCEKPMATNSCDALAMVETARRNGRILMIGHNQRLAPAHAMAKRFIDSGKFGKVLSFQTSFAHGGPESWLKTGDAQNIWFFNPTKSAFGVLGDLGIHKLDLICWFLNESPQKVLGIVGTLDKRNVDGTSISVEDNAAVVLQFPSGTLGTMLTSWTSYGEEDNSTVLNCEKGIIQIYRNGIQLRLIHADGKSEIYAPGNIQTNDDQTKSGIIDLFIEGIIKNTSPIPGEDGLRALKIVEECLQQHS